ncbi:hypothetical protein OIPHN260_15770 [Enterobacter roggenkampii]|uniref:Uncharacterized protein n=1 Tax=Enterobacter roggenkampii TaxID=1812935 RepID=A0AAU9BMD6_9ENTR|nr:hypothetical protein OIPHN260_15770 [Enterobacter roggenkampii]
MFPLTPSLSLKGEGVVRAGLSPVGEDQGEGIRLLLTLNIKNIRTQMVVVNFL